MMTIISGVGLLLLTLAVFSIFSLKFPKGSQAMSGMANAAVASFLIEASTSTSPATCWELLSWARLAQLPAAWVV